MLIDDHHRSALHPDESFIAKLAEDGDLWMAVEAGPPDGFVREIVSLKETARVCEPYGLHLNLDAPPH